MASRLCCVHDSRPPCGRADALAACAAWLRGHGRGLPLPEGSALGPGESNPRLHRTAFFLLALESSPDLARSLSEALQRALAGTEAAATLADIGIPLDVRHVTLSTGMLALAASAASPTVAAIPWAEIGWASLGIALIFVLNLAVSFLLALGLALRAHGVPMFEMLRLGRKIVGRFARDPWAFVGPPKA